MDLALQLNDLLPRNKGLALGFGFRFKVVVRLVADRNIKFLCLELLRRQLARGICDDGTQLMDLA